MLQGLLSGSMEEVNAVNAGMLAKDRGIELMESACESSDHFATLLKLEVEGDEGKRSVSGTLFGESRPRLVSIDTCEVEIAPEGNLIFFQNEDKPGVSESIGAVAG